MVPSTWTHMTAPSKMTVTDAIREVFSSIHPAPVSIQVTATTICSALGLHELTTRNDYEAFILLVQAAVRHAMPTPRLQDDVKDGLGKFCQRRGVKINAIG